MEGAAAGAAVEAALWPSFAVVVLTALLTNVGTFFITRYTLTRGAEKEEQAKREERERHARYLAVRVVCVLDPFVLGCCDVVADEGTYDEHQMRQTTVRTPTLEFPEDVDWRSVKPDLMYRILTLPNEVDNAGRAISAAYDLGDGPPDFDDTFEERSYQYAKLGLAAMDLAREIRTAYGLAHPDYSKWDPRKSLERAFAAEDDRRRMAAEAAERIIAGHEKKKAAKAAD
jgi:hypothetical protein